MLSVLEIGGSVLGDATPYRTAARVPPEREGHQRPRTSRRNHLRAAWRNGCTARRRQATTAEPDHLALDLLWHLPLIVRSLDQNSSISSIQPRSH
jgi:hypothetical protein